MTFIYGLLESAASYLFPAAEPVKKGPSERDLWIRRYNRATVNLIVGKTDLDALPLSKNLALFRKVHWLFLQAQAVRKEWGVELLPALSGKIDPADDFDAFRKKVAAAAKAIRPNFEVVPYVPPSTTLKSPKAAPVSTLLVGSPKSEPARTLPAGSPKAAPVKTPPAGSPKREVFKAPPSSPTGGETHSFVSSSPASGLGISSRAAPVPEDEEQESSPRLRSIRVLAPPPQPSDDLDAIRPGVHKAPEEAMFNERVLKLKTEIDGQRMTPEHINAALQFDRTALSHLADQIDLAENSHLAPFYTAIRREADIVKFELKLEEIGAYQQYLADVRQALKKCEPDKRADLEAQENAIVKKLGELRHRCLVVMDKLAVAPVMIKPAAAALKPSREPYLVCPIGNVLFLETIPGKGECEATGKWAIADLYELSPDIRQKISPLLTPEFLEAQLKDKPAGVPVRFRVDGNAMRPAPNGPIKIFYEEPKDVFGTHLGRPTGEKVRILRNKDKESRYRRVLVDRNGYEKGTEKSVDASQPQRSFRTAMIDRAQAVWLARFVAREVLLGNGDRLDFRMVQRCYRYLAGIWKSDVAARYENDPVLIESYNLIRSALAALEDAAKERLSMKTLLSDVRSKPTDFSDAMKAAIEFSSTYKNWLAAINQFLALVKSYPKFEEQFRQYSILLEQARPHIDLFASRLPTREQIEMAAKTGSQQTVLDALFSAFYGKSNQASELQFNHFDILKSALNQLQSMTGNPVAEEERKALLAQFFASESSATLDHLEGRILEKFPSANQTQLKKLAQEIRAAHKAMFKKEVNPASLAFMAGRIPAFYDGALKAAAIAALRQLEEMQKAAELAFSSVFQVPRRTGDLVETVYKANRDLTMNHFQALETVGRVGYSYAGIELLATR